MTLKSLFSLPPCHTYFKYSGPTRLPFFAPQTFIVDTGWIFLWSGSFLGAWAKGEHKSPTRQVTLLSLLQRREASRLGCSGGGLWDERGVQEAYEGVLLGPAPTEGGKKGEVRLWHGLTGHSGVQTVLRLVQVGVRGLGFVLLCWWDLECNQERRRGSFL